PFQIGQSIFRHDKKVKWLPRIGRATSHQRTGFICFIKCTVVRNHLVVSSCRVAVAFESDQLGRQLLESGSQENRYRYTPAKCHQLVARMEFRTATPTLSTGSAVFDKTITATFLSG